MRATLGWCDEGREGIRALGKHRGHVHGRNQGHAVNVRAVIRAAAVPVMRRAPAVAILRRALPLWSVMGMAAVWVVRVHPRLGDVLMVDVPVAHLSKHGFGLEGQGGQQQQ